MKDHLPELGPRAHKPMYAPSGEPYDLFEKAAMIYIWWMNLHDN